MRTIMVTGATQGLGLATVTALSEIPGTRVILAARNLQKAREIAGRLGPQAEAVGLDLSSLHNVARFVQNWDRKLDGLINNAGMQFTGQEHFTPDKFEETIAVNHLAAFALTVGLQKYLNGGRVLFIGSGTHNPNNKAAVRFGFRGAQYSSVFELAEGKSDNPDIASRNLDRYATSKFLNSVTGVELSKRFKDFESYVLDPGLMPGTGLARSRGALLRFLWKYLFPVIAVFMEDASNTRRSGKTAAWIMTAEKLGYPPGTIFSFTRKPCPGVWEEKVYDPQIGAEVYSQSLQIAKKFLV